jgi:hypothetical protein
MRYHEIASGMRVPVSAEEQQVLDLSKDGVLKHDGLDERNQEVARTMVSRGLLNRQNNGIYKISSTAGIRRD